MSALRFARVYAAIGWKVFPVYEAVEGRCSCQAGKDCHSPGKHPRTAHGFKDATNDASIIAAWWRDWPRANIGVATGHASGIAVLDVDPRNDGLATLESMMEQHGSMPHTPKAQTGGGGLHFVFAYPSEGPVPSRTIGPGLDFKGDNGYVVVAPSQHVSGGHYRWLDCERPDELAVAGLPSWLLELAQGRDGERAGARLDTADVLQGVTEGHRDIDLFRLACKLRRVDVPQDMAESLIIEAAANCSPPFTEEVALAKVRGAYARYQPGEGETAVMPPSVEWPSAPRPEAYHGLAGDVVRAIEPHSEADPAALLLTFLTCFGAAVGDGPHYLVEGDKHPARLFTVLVGPTGAGRKGTSWGRINQLFEQVRTVPDYRDLFDPEPAQTASGLSSGEGLIWHVRDSTTKLKRRKNEDSGHWEYRMEVDDPGVDDKRLLAYESELGRMLRVMSREGNPLSAIQRQAWDSGDLAVLNKNQPYKATGAHISIIGHITREELLVRFDSTEAANGFGNRYLWIAVRRSKLLAEGGEVPSETIVALASRLLEALRFARDRGRLRRSTEASQMWAQAYVDLTADRPGLFGAITGRAEAQVTRLSLIFALLDSSPEIRPEHLEAALAVWDYAERSSRWIWGDGLGNADADRVFEALRNRGALTQNQIFREVFQGNVKSGRIGKALAVLEAAGLVQRREQETNGRSTTIWSPHDGVG